MKPSEAAEILEGIEEFRGNLPEDGLLVEEAVSMAISALKERAWNDWILCSERMPEECEWIGTKHFGTTISDEVYVTFEAPSGERFAKHIMFQNGRLSSSDQRVMDTVFKGAKPIAWRPHPEPYKGDL